MLNTKQIEDSERQRCEVWTRVMGYHRPVSQYNPGKRSEHKERCFFKESGSLRGSIAQ
jgi:anaerobic ribonucleoside-triphosphate reductase